jgi:hypothetical protein
MTFENVRLMEERNEGLIGCLHQQKLQWVSVESDAFQRLDDGMEKSAARNYKSKTSLTLSSKTWDGRQTVANSTHVFVSENPILVEVCESSGLFNERRRQSIRVCFVMSELGMNIVVDLSRNFEHARLRSIISRYEHSTARRLINEHNLTIMEREETNDVLQVGRSAEDEVTNPIEERLSVLRFSLECVGCIDFFDMFSESLDKRVR